MIISSNDGYYFAPGRRAEYCDLRVCLSMIISKKNSHVQTSSNFLFILPVATAQSSLTTVQYFVTSSFVDDVMMHVMA